MKTRDIFKYALASLIALVTIAGICAMRIAKSERKARSEEEAMHIRQTLDQNGLNGELPGKMDPNNPAVAQGK